MANNVIPMQTIAPLRPVDMNANQLELIKRTIARDCSPDEFDLFIEVARRVGLDPFRRQLYCNIYSKDNPEKRSMVLITGIDGFRAVAARNNNYRPDEDEAEIVVDDGLKDPDSNPRGIEKAVVSVYKSDAKGEWHRIRATARWEEFAPIEEKIEWIDTGEVWPDSGKPKKERRHTGEFTLDPKNPNSFWRRMPHLMLAKCAEAQALRKGWPEDLSAVYAPEELAQSDMIELSASEVIAEAEKERHLIHVKAANTILFLWAAGEPLEAVPMGELADRCIEFIGQSESATQLESWETANTAGLREFWARSKSDAFAVKKALEAKIQALAAPVIEAEDES